MLALKGLNEKGLRKFSLLLKDFKSRGTLSLDEMNIECRKIHQNPNLTLEYPQFNPIDENKLFTSKFSFFCYLNKDVFASNIPTIDIFNWLTIVYFPQFLKKNRKIESIEKYVMTNSGRRAYKHLIRTPFLLFKEYIDIPLAESYFKYKKLYDTGDFYENWAGRKDICWDRTSTTVLFKLYITSTGKEKKGFANKKRGSIQNFGIYHSQLSLTHSIADMESDYLLSILPPNFNKFKEEPQPVLF